MLRGETHAPTLTRIPTLTRQEGRVVEILDTQFAVEVLPLGRGMTFHRLLSRTASIRAAASQSARVAATQPAQVLERTPTSVFRSLKKSMSRSTMEVDSIQERRGSRSD